MFHLAAWLPLNNAEVKDPESPLLFLVFCINKQMLTNKSKCDFNFHNRHDSCGNWSSCKPTAQWQNVFFPGGGAAESLLMTCNVWVLSGSRLRRHHSVRLVLCAPVLVSHLPEGCLGVFNTSLVSQRLPVAQW